MSIAEFIRRLEADCKFDKEKYREQSILLNCCLSEAVPLWFTQLEELKKATTDSQFSVELSRRTSESAKILADHGDALMFKTKETALAFNALAAGIACLAFCPGGVTVFGIHWEYKRVQRAARNY